MYVLNFLVVMIIWYIFFIVGYFSGHDRMVVGFTATCAISAHQ
jgi:hypothetical protein